MTKDKRPSFQWYPKDYLADENVVLMSLEEQGAYVRLMCFCWLEGSIPCELPKLARLCGVSPADMERLWTGVENCFVRVGDRMTHPRLDTERKKQDAYKEAKKKAGRKGAKAKHDKAKAGSATVLPQAKSAFSSASPSASPSAREERPSVRTASDQTDGQPANLREYLGEYAGSANHVGDMDQRRIFGLYGPNGTQAERWGGIAPERRPPLLATAVLSWEPDEKRGFYRPFFETILDRVISDAIAHDHGRDKRTREAQEADELQRAAREHEAREIERLEAEGKAARVSLPTSAARGGGAKRLSIGVDPAA